MFLDEQNATLKQEAYTVCFTLVIINQSINQSRYLLLAANFGPRDSNLPQVKSQYTLTKLPFHDEGSCPDWTDSKQKRWSREQSKIFHFL
jgi:hypothetical protein